MTATSAAPHDPAPGQPVVGEATALAAERLELALTEGQRQAS